MLVVPLKISSDISEFATELSSAPHLSIIPVKPDTNAYPLSCSLNVMFYVKKHGGNAVKGWRLWWIPNVLIEAQAHVIWQSNTGELLDVSPNADGEETCFFVSDESMSLDPGRDYIPSKYKNICGNHFIDNYTHNAGVRAKLIDNVRMTGITPPELTEINRKHIENLQKLEQFVNKLSSKG